MPLLVHAEYNTRLISMRANIIHRHNLSKEVKLETTLATFACVMIALCAGCSTTISRGPSGGLRQDSSSAAAIPTSSQSTSSVSEPSSIIAMDTPMAMSDDPGLYVRRDSALALRFPGTLAQAEAWEPAPTPDVSSWQRITLSNRPESYIFFRDERSRRDHRHWRYRY